MVEKNVSVRMAAVGGKAVKAEFVDIGREGTRALGGIANASGATRAGLQNVGYQVQDFAVQVAGGTSASRALSQQLPQLLSGFGLLGVGLGTAAAVFIPLISSMLGAKEKAADLKDQLDQLARASNTYQSALNDALTPMEKLRAEFGDQAVAVRALYDARLALEKLNFIESQKAAADALAQSFAGLGEQLALINEGLAANLGAGQIGAQIQLETQIGNLTREFGLSVDQANALNAAVGVLSAAQGPVEVAAATEAVREAMTGAGNAVANLPAPMRAAVESAIELELQARELAAKLGISVDLARELGQTDMSGGLRAANAEAATLVQRIDQAIKKGQEQQIAYKLATMPGANLRAGDDERGSQSDARRNAAEYNRKRILENIPFFSGKSGSSGGGGGGGQKAQNDVLREAERIFDQTRTAAEKYATEQQRLDELLKSGAISQDTYSRAMEQLKDKTNDASTAASDMRSTFEEAFVDIITGAKSGKDALAGLASSFAKMLAQKGISQLFNSIFPSLAKNADGNAFSGGSVVPFAAGGVVGSPTLFPMRGKIGLMGESGPEAIMPLTRIGGKLGVRALGGSGAVSMPLTINVDARGAVEGVADQVAKAVQAQTPSIIAQAVAAGGAARKRGYAV